MNQLNKYFDSLVEGTLLEIHFAMLDGYTRYSQKEIEAEQQRLFDVLTQTYQDFEENKLSEEDFLLFYVCFVNFYYSFGMHLCHSPVDLTRKTKEIIQKIDKAHMLAEAIYQQDSRLFRELAQVESMKKISSYYIFILEVDDFFHSLKDEKDISKAKQSLCESFQNYTKNKIPAIEFPISWEKLGLTMPTFPYVRYAFTLCDTVVEMFQYLDQKDDDNNSDYIDFDSYYNDDDQEESLKTKKVKELCREYLDKTQRSQIAISVSNPKALEHENTKIRMEYLKMPYKIDMDQGAFSLLLQSFQNEIELEKINKELEAEKRKREDILSQFSHNYRNMQFPEKIDRVASTLYLRNNQEDQSLSEILSDAYQVQMHYKNSAMLLKLRCDASNPQDFNKELNRYIRTYQDDGNMNFCNIIYIFYHCFRFSMFRLLFSDENQKKHDSYSLSVQTKHKELQKSYLETQRDCYEEEKYFDVIDWFQEQVYALELDEEQQWDSIEFEQESPTSTFFMEILTNIILNSLNYGDKTKNGKISIKFYETEHLAMPCFACRCENLIGSADSSFLKSHGFGLQYIKEDIALVNQTKDLEKFVKITQGDSYMIEFFIQKTHLERE